MKNLPNYFIIGGLFILVSLSSPAGYCQKYEECCDDLEKEEQYYKYITELKEKTDKVKQLESEISKLDKDIEKLKGVYKEKSNLIDNLQAEYDLLLASLNLLEYDKKFNESESKILNRKGSPADIRKFYYDEIALSKAKCLPKYYNRFSVLKMKLEEWEKDEQKKQIASENKINQYKVVKGDCLWKIAERSDVYGNARMWVKIWEANRKKVLSTPKGIPDKVLKPDLIYPGQILNIPILTESEKKIIKNKLDAKKKVRKSVEKKKK